MSDTNQGCAATEDIYRLKTSDLGRRDDCSIYVVKTKALICAVVFAYTKAVLL